MRRRLVAVSDIPELVELVDDGVTGAVFRTEDAASLAAALKRLAAMPDDERAAMRGRARQVYASTFTRAAMTERYNKVYADVVRTRTPFRIPA